MTPDPEEPSSSSPGMSAALKGVPVGPTVKTLEMPTMVNLGEEKPNTVSLTLGRSGGPLERNEGEFVPSAKTHCGHRVSPCVFPFWP